MNATQEYTQEEIEQRARENSEMYFKWVNNEQYIKSILMKDIEDSFYW